MVEMERNRFVFSFECFYLFYLTCVGSDPKRTETTSSFVGPNHEISIPRITDTELFGALRWWRRKLLLVEYPDVCHSEGSCPGTIVYDIIKLCRISVSTIG